MTTSVWLKAFVLWLAILALAILNGILREKMMIPIFGSFTGFVISGVILCIFILGVAIAAVPWYGQLTSGQLYLVGVFWLLLTVGFEFSFGIFVQNKSLVELFEAYTFRGGNLWPVVLLVTFVSPWVAAKVRNLV